MLSSTFIDEFGYLNLKPEQSNTFFKLMDERYTRHSTILTTNLVYDEWQNFLGNKSMVDVFWFSVKMRATSNRRGEIPALRAGDFQGMRIYRSDVLLGVFVG
ncbi:MAG: ATP-binding protein, partial [Bryobacteraceae bacterium]